ncbi:hypothetical protein KIPB_001959 [Kipferlia bialata]|uniref:Uncharacterized protein n=1 Tax=Kipferlia bialata TaxID=797122 RepID=A0A9K3CPN6_9EUKA|nr:hypothetical protein KIPB_001959 [Kipferlia bialata]|eukprot:g1959.t1
MRFRTRLRRPDREREREESQMDISEPLYLRPVVDVSQSLTATHSKRPPRITLSRGRKHGDIYVYVGVLNDVEGGTFDLILWAEREQEPGWNASQGDRAMRRVSIALIPSAVLEFIAYWNREEEDGVVYSMLAFVSFVVGLFVLSVLSMNTITNTMTPGRGKESAMWLLASWDASLPSPMAVRSAHIAKAAGGKLIYNSYVATTPSRKGVPRVLTILEGHFRLFGILVGSFVGAIVSHFVPGPRSIAYPYWMVTTLFFGGHILVTKILIVVYSLTIAGRPRQRGPMAGMYGNAAMSIVALTRFTISWFVHLDKYAVAPSAYTTLPPESSLWVWLCSFGPWVTLAVSIVTRIILPHCRSLIGLALCDSSPLVPGYMCIAFVYGSVAACIHSRVLLVLWAMPVLMVYSARITTGTVGLNDSPTSTLRSLSIMIMLSSATGVTVCMILGTLQGVVLGEGYPAVWQYLPDWLCTKGICLSGVFSWHGFEPMGVLIASLCTFWLGAEAVGFIAQKRRCSHFLGRVGSEMHRTKLYTHLWAASEQYRADLKQKQEAEENRGEGEGEREAKTAIKVSGRRTFVNMHAPVACSSGHQHSRFGVPPGGLEGGIGNAVRIALRPTERRRPSTHRHRSSSLSQVTGPYFEGGLPKCGIHPLTRVNSHSHSQTLSVGHTDSSLDVRLSTSRQGPGHF